MTIILRKCQAQLCFRSYDDDDDVGDDDDYDDGDS